MKCIYCFTENESKFDGKEHVIPQAFGTFGNATPTLKSVCDECNAYFSKELDHFLARESIEGVTRYQKKMYSGEARQQKEIFFVTPRIPELGDYGGTMVWVDGTTGHIQDPIGQVHIPHTESGEDMVFLEAELEDLDWRQLGLETKGIKIFGSTEEQARLIEKLKIIGIDLKNTTKLLPLDYPAGVPLQVEIHGKIDKRMQRAYAKIIFNFTAKYIGDYEVLKKEWDPARRFIRFGEGLLDYQPINGSFWANETESMRVGDIGYNLTIAGVNGNMQGSIQMFNLLTHEFIMVKGHVSLAEAAMRFEPGRAPMRATRRGLIDIVQMNENGQYVIL